MQIARKIIGESSLTFEWADETKTKVSLGDFDADTIQRAALHGLAQKLGDSYAGVLGDVELAKNNLGEVLTALKEGDWNRKGVLTGGIWVEALAQAAKVPFAEALEKWTDMPDSEKKAVKKHPDVKLAKLEIEQAKAKKAAAASTAPAISLS